MKKAIFGTLAAGTLMLGLAVAPPAQASVVVADGLWTESTYALNPGHVHNSECYFVPAVSGAGSHYRCETAQPNYNFVGDTFTNTHQEVLTTQRFGGAGGAWVCFNHGRAPGSINAEWRCFNPADIY